MPLYSFQCAVRAKRSEGVGTACICPQVSLEAGDHLNECQFVLIRACSVALGLLLAVLSSPQLLSRYRGEAGEGDLN